MRGDIANDCLVSVDGTDFRIEQRGRKFFSHKFKGSGLRYEVAISILCGEIVWVNGPYPPGRYNDLMVFRDSLMSILEDGERVEADDGYLGEAPKFVKCPASVTARPECLAMQKRVRSRQETVNLRFKMWNILSDRFRHDISMHGDVVIAIAVFTQLSIEAGEPLFSVNYCDDNPSV